MSTQKTAHVIFRLVGAQPDETGEKVTFTVTDTVETNLHNLCSRDDWTETDRLAQKVLDRARHHGWNGEIRPLVIAQDWDDEPSRRARDLFMQGVTTYATLTTGEELPRTICSAQSFVEYYTYREMQLKPVSWWRMLAARKWTAAWRGKDWCEETKYRLRIVIYVIDVHTAKTLADMYLSPSIEEFRARRERIVIPPALHQHARALDSFIPCSKDCLFGGNVIKVDRRKK